MEKKKTIRKQRAKKVVEPKIEKAVEVKEKVKVPVIEKGEFIVCPKCGWTHARETRKCRFCGTLLYKEV